MMRGGVLLRVALVFLLAARGVSQSLVLGGACDFFNFLNGLVFQEEGTTKSGAPYYKASGANYYLYHDPNCYGGMDMDARWIVDSDLPSTTRVQDLDADGDCKFQAYVKSSAFRPPSTTWKMFCDAAWKDVFLTWTEVPLDDSLGGPTTTAAPRITTITTTTTESVQVLRLMGACDYIKFLNGKLFYFQGTTLSGAPFYKAVGQEYYIYHDPDCHGGSDDTPRWIVDSDAPNTARREDLDSDGDCKYMARIDSLDIYRPPVSARWQMYCPSAEERVMTLDEVTSTTTTTVSSSTTSTVSSTSTSTTTMTATSTTGTGTTYTVSTTTTSTPTTTSTTITATDTSTTETSTTTSTSTTTTTVLESCLNGRWNFTCSEGYELLKENTSSVTCEKEICEESDNTTCCEPLEVTTDTTTTTVYGLASTSIAATSQMLLLNGACDDLKYLNGLLFREQGTTASGAPFYKAEARGIYIYHDLDCNGKATEAPRWVIDDGPPTPSRLKDLDEDDACIYLARKESTDATRPPATGTWSMMCRGAWQDQSLTLQTITAPATTTRATTTNSTSTKPLKKLILSGACPFQDYLNGVVFKMQGTTVSGSPHYKSENSVPFYYIYYDPHCDGATANARWVIDTSVPDPTRTEDLDNDQTCNFLARISTDDKIRPPSSSWKMYCTGGWQDQPLVLSEANASTSAKEMTAVTNTAAAGGGALWMLLLVLVFSAALLGQL